mmetsp:Transcript_26518/g.38016  ORF Transcript_26518/g.38016 Transcript_26518/m.38016 type:complete len:306 (-) Transcript_26518:536-1453(-)
MIDKFKLLQASVIVLTIFNKTHQCDAFGHSCLSFRTSHCFALHESPSQEDSPVPFESGSHQELMYTLGVNLARQLGDVRPLVENGEELSNVARGVLDVVVGKLDEGQQAKLLVANKEKLNQLLVERTERIKKILEESGRAMLEEMKKIEGTTKLDSGVVLHLLEPGPEGPGNGVRPTAASSVQVHYHGTLPDGTVFDSSLGGEPVNIALGQVIPGWKEGLLKMHEGETVMLGIPPTSAYGENGSPDGRIPGGATVFFKVQLIKVLSAGIGGSAKLFGADGNELNVSTNKSKGATGLLFGADGRPL